ncbi:MAG: hypothetical protein ABI939_05700 [Anaerolineaceae bacterium]
MTTQLRPIAHEERDEWVVDAATGRIIRREAARRSEASEHRPRSGEVHVRPDGKTFNRQHWDDRA